MSSSATISLLPSREVLGHAALLRDIAAASFVQGRAYGKTVNGSQQKAVLLSIAACPGRRISLKAIAELAGCSEVTTHRAVRALMGSGVLVELPSSRMRSSAYAIDEQALGRFIHPVMDAALGNPFRPPFQLPEDLNAHKRTKAAC